MFRIMGSILVAGCFLLGCERVSVETPLNVFERPTDEEFVAAVLVDLSGSFIEQMAEQGHAYRFLMEVSNQLARDRPGQESRLILSQISGSQDPLLWEGNPNQLRRDFANQEKFREFLMSKAAGGSRVHESLAKTFAYINLHDAIRRNAKSAVFVLSDMVDTSTDHREQLVELEKQLAVYQSRGGTIGMYFVNQNLVVQWKAALKRGGFQSFVVESDIVTRPSIPSFN